MKKFLISIFVFLAFSAIACGGSKGSSSGSDSGGGSLDSGEISIMLPADYDAVCGESDEDLDRTYCIDPEDQIIVSIYGREQYVDEWTLALDKKFQVNKFGSDSVLVPFKLDKKYRYLRFFAKVLNPNKNLKLTGGLDNVTQSNSKLFLAPTGDFARVVSDRSNPMRTSLESYFDDGGSKGSAAVALKDGRIFMAGGYDLEDGVPSNKAVIFDMNSLSKKEAKNLPARLYDHIAAFLDDGSESGKVVVGLGTTEDDVLNDSVVWVYDPKNDKYELLALPGAPGMTKAKAITIDGDVYIAGGCTDSGASNAVYKISAKTGSVIAEQFATLKQGRCNHAIADISTANEVRILVIGGSTDKTEGQETPITGDNFAELVTQGVSIPMAVADRNGGDDAELKTKGLISPAAAAVVLDDKGTAEKVVSVAGGYIRDGEYGEYEDAKWITNPTLFVFSVNGEKLVYDSNGTPFECTRPSMAALGTWNNDFSGYAAVNCGVSKIERRRPDSQVIFVIQVKRVKDADGKEIFSSSVKESQMDGNYDPESDAVILDGPVAADALGQVFMLGGKYVYQAGSYAIPGTEYSDAPKDLPSKPIIHVAFESPSQPPMSYRNIYDKVIMNLKETCVSNPDAPDKCLENWQERYYIKYKWEMTESPTPLLDESKLQLENSGSAGQWLPDDGKRDDPKRAKFRGLMITPRRYPGESNPTYNAEKCSSECGAKPVDNGDKYFFKTLSDYLVCRQKYCEETRTKYYKVNIQAETVDKATGLTSDTADITVVPEIIPQARVVAQLTWKQGYRTKAESESKEGVSVDLDLHLIKKTSIEAPQYGFTPTEGLLGTSQRPEYMDDTCPVTLEECEKYWRHDDCWFGDWGTDYYVEEGRTIQWHASLDIDNTWGGNNYETPETIGLGSTVRNDNIIDDQYLIVVSYVNCISNYSEGGDHCDPKYTGEDSAYEVDARVDILIDGEDAPRKGSSDSYSATSKDFKIKVNEWKAIAVVKWDSGNAIVTDKAMPDEGITTDPVNHPVCTYDNSDAVLIPIWDAETYKSYIETPYDEYEYSPAIGTCR